VSFYRLRSAAGALNRLARHTINTKQIEKQM
jgi:hypothetical protein